MLKKGKLIIGDTSTFGIVGLSAPDAKWYPDLYDSGIKALNNRGIKTIEGATVRTEYFYLTGEPQAIANSLHEMFLRKDIDVVMCAGGGVSINKILPFIDFSLIRQNMKPFIGISNITALMIAMLNEGIVSFHGPFSIWSYGLPWTPTDFTHDNMIKSLNGFAGTLPKKTEWKSYRKGEATGGLIGGNIWTLGTIAGSRFCPPELFEGKILLLEDIGKTYDRLDATLTLLKLQGVFDKLKGVVIGKLNDCKSPEKVQMSIEDWIGLVFGEYTFPIIYDCDFGHIPDNLCLPIGCEAKMIASEDSQLILLEAGVE